MYAFDAYSYIVLSVQRTLHILILHLRPIIPLSLRLILVLCCLCRGTLPILILHSRPTLPLPSRPILVLCCLCRGTLPILILLSRPTVPLPLRPILICVACAGGGAPEAYTGIVVSVGTGYSRSIGLFCSWYQYLKPFRACWL